MDDRNHFRAAYSDGYLLHALIKASAQGVRINCADTPAGPVYTVIVGDRKAGGHNPLKAIQEALCSD